MSNTRNSGLNSMVTDQNQKPVQIGSSFTTADITGTPKTSPLSYGTLTVITLAVPTNAVEFIVNPSSALRVSEVVGMAQYDVVAANSKEAISCARMDSIFVVGDSATGTCNFRFTLI